jgi:hypothetical protein
MRLAQCANTQSCSLFSLCSTLRSSAFSAVKMLLTSPSERTTPEFHSSPGATPATADTIELHQLAHERLSDASFRLMPTLPSTRNSEEPLLAAEAADPCGGTLISAPCIDPRIFSVNTHSMTAIDSVASRTSLQRFGGSADA